MSRIFRWSLVHQGVSRAMSRRTVQPIALAQSRKGMLRSTNKVALSDVARPRLD